MWGFGESYNRQKMIQKAEESFLKGYEIDPHNIDVLIKLGAVVSLRDCKKGRSYLEQACSLFPSSCEALCSLAENFLKDDLDEAEKKFKAILKLDDQNVRAREGLGKIAILRVRPQEALAHFEYALEKDPQNPFVLLSLGKAMLLLGRFQEAEKFYTRVMVRDKTDTRSLISLGELKIEQKEFGQAEHYFQKASQLDPQDVFIYFGLGNATFEGSPAQAKIHYLKALSLVPPNEQKTRLLILFKLARLAKKEKQPSEAQKYFEQILEIEPHHLEALAERNRA